MTNVKLLHGHSAYSTLSQIWTIVVSFETQTWIGKANKQTHTHRHAHTHKHTLVCQTMQAFAKYEFWKNIGKWCVHRVRYLASIFSLYERAEWVGGGDTQKAGFISDYLDKLNAICQHMGLWNDSFILNSRGKYSGTRVIPPPQKKTPPEFPGREGEASPRHPHLHSWEGELHPPPRLPHLKFMKGFAPT